MDYSEDGSDETVFSGYLDVVNGIGQEDIYYGYNEDDQATSESMTQKMESNFNLFREDGGIVMTVDYPFAE